MNFTNININDPAGVKALLEQLKASQAWQDVVTVPTESAPQPAPGPSSSTSAPHIQAVHPSTAVNLVDIRKPSTPISHPPGSDLLPNSSGHPSDVPLPSVASLLSQLQNTSVPATSASPPPPHIFVPPVSSVSPALAPAPAPSYHSSADANAAPPGALPSSARREDLRSLTFQQALPHLARLAEDPGFLELISTMRKEQGDLERQLWDERSAILRKHEEKVKVAHTKATIVGGTGLTQFEADVMSDAFRQELRKFDAQRVLPAWDGLIAKQQARLEGLGVPAMFPTLSSADLERQQRVIQVLVGIAGNDDL